MAADARAQILAQAGDANGALDEIERLLPGPSWLSMHTLHLAPRWDPIRNHPLTKTQLAKYGTGEARWTTVAAESRGASHTPGVTPTGCSPGLVT